MTKHRKGRCRVRKYDRQCYAVILCNSYGVDQIIAQYRTRDAAASHASMFNKARSAQ